MTQMPLTLDLNLLAKLDALLDECHVSKAAVRVGISQSAMSRSLAQLREVFSDELLVRGRGGLELTARGAELKARVRVALDHVDAVMRDRVAFDPATAQRTFIIASADYAAALLMSDVVQRLVAESPASDIIVRTAARPPNVLFAASLENPEVDLVIGPRVKAPAGVVWTPLFREQFVCVAAQHDGRVGARMTLKTFLSLPHVAVAPGGTRGSLVDDVLESRGLARRVALRVPTFLLAAYMVSQGNLIGWGLPRAVGAEAGGAIWAAGVEDAA